MPGRWLAAVMMEISGLLLWASGWTLDLTAIMPLALYLGTIAPSTVIAADLGRRFLPVTGAQLFRLFLGVINGGVLIAIAVVHLLAEDGPFMFLSSVSVALWGTFTVGATLGGVQLVLCVLMARNFFRVRSARARGVGALLVAAGTIGLTLPLVLVDMVQQWPLFSLPAIVMALMGQRRLDM